jgi:hypothetical protein
MAGSPESWGLIVEDVIFQIDDVDPADRFHEDFIWAPLTGVTPAPQIGWTATQADGVWTFAPPAPPTLTLAQQAIKALGGGVTISLTGSMTLAPTVFPTDAASLNKLTQVTLVITATGGLPGGAAAMPVRDASGNWREFTPDIYKAVAVAISAWAATLQLIIDGYPGAPTALPSSVIPALTV